MLRNETNKDLQRISFLLGAALRVGDDLRFIYVYDNLIPSKVPRETIAEIKEEARNIADLSDDEFLARGRSLTSGDRFKKRPNGRTENIEKYITNINDHIMAAHIENKISCDIKGSNIPSSEEVFNNKSDSRLERIDSQSSSVYASCDETIDTSTSNGLHEDQKPDLKGRRKKANKKSTKEDTVDFETENQQKVEETSLMNISTSEEVPSSKIIEPCNDSVPICNGEVHEEEVEGDFQTVKSRRKKVHQPNGKHYNKNYTHQHSLPQSRQISPTYTDESSSVTDCTLVLSDSCSVGSDLVVNGAAPNSTNSYANCLKKSLPSSESSNQGAESAKTSPSNVQSEFESPPPPSISLEWQVAADNEVPQPTVTIGSSESHAIIQSLLSFQYEGSVSPPSQSQDELSPDRIISITDPGNRPDISSSVNTGVALLPTVVGVGMLQFGDIDMSDLDRSTGNFNLFEATSFLAKGWEQVLSSNPVPCYGAEGSHYPRGEPEKSAGCSSEVASGNTPSLPVPASAV